jgi:hypothetical protein
MLQMLISSPKFMGDNGSTETEIEALAVQLTSSLTVTEYVPAWFAWMLGVFCPVFHNYVVKLFPGVSTSVKMFSQKTVSLPKLMSVMVPKSMFAVCVELQEFSSVTVRLY